ncbi:hypothetical protein [Streptomyces catenulae]|uniref:Uncharacterized protein n=1 Tax=Streptomyces catenulae TaxID=66875 RepID=A0ABV2YTH4_9ACTN|nr:hypothetical protein [Streptomyces catenulae]
MGAHAATRRRDPHAARARQPDGYERPDVAAWARERTSDADLIRLVEALRRWEAADDVDPVSPVALDAIRTSAECALSLHRRGDPDGECTALLDAVSRYLSRLVAYAEDHLDTGRIVVCQTLRRARSAQQNPDQRSPEIAVAARDLVCLLGPGRELTIAGRPES